MEKPDIVKVLEDAQLAHRAGDFVNALKFYEYFFDHALDDDPYALYGVRLSYCLEGWADLATEFPGAKNRLNAKRRSALEQYLESRNPERFHDFVNICRSLGLEAQALEAFLEHHSKEPKSAAKLAKYLWNDLLLGEHWQVCSELMPEASLKMDELFAVFDEASKLKDIDPSFSTPKFDQHIVDTLLDDLQNVVMVCRHNNRSDDITNLQHQFLMGVEQRDHATLSKQVHAKAAFMFAGH